MDPVSMALIAAIAAGVAKGAGDVAEAVVSDAYRALKRLLARKFGQDSEVVEAVDAAESKPDSQARKSVLSEEIEASGALTDPEIVAAASRLLELLGAPVGSMTIQQASGSNIAQAAPGAHAVVQTGLAPDPPQR
jgi:hypothetical protein